MSRVIQKLILLVVTVHFLILFCAGSEAAIYKWRDENGKIHFTDNPSRVPEEFREEKMRLRALPRIKATKVKPEPETKEEEKQIPPLPGETKGEPGEKKSNPLTGTDKSALESVVAFFEEDMPRYDAIYQRPLSAGNAMKTKWRILRSAVLETIPQKEGVLEQVSTSMLPLLKEIASFLKKMIQEDEKLKEVKALLSDNTRPQINNLSNRLKSQASSENEYLKKIEEALQTPEEKQKK